MSAVPTAILEPPNDLAERDAYLLDLPTDRSRPHREEIASLARFYWEERLRDNTPGTAEDDWFRAERALS